MIHCKFQAGPKKYRKSVIQTQILCGKVAIARGRNPETGGPLHQRGLRWPGLHLEINPRGGKLSILIKERGKNPCVYMHKHTSTRESGGLLPQLLSFRLSEFAYAVFSGTLNIEMFWKHLIHYQ